MTRRYGFLDVYRGLIVVLMIEGHAVREVLQPALQATAAFRLHEFLHGITGPGFLFGAGITFGVSVQRRLPEFLRLSPVLVRRLGKIVLLLLLGYGLHLPFFSLRKTIEETSPEGWTRLFAFDVLQCIAFSLLILYATLLLVRRQRAFAVTAAAVGIALVAAAPLIWRMDLSGVPLPLSMGLQGVTGSVYPIVPYGAFLIAGAIASFEFTRFTAEGRERVFMKSLALTGILCIAAGTALEWVPVQIFPETDFWNESPAFFTVKLGGLFLLLAAAWRAGTMIPQRLQAPLHLLGRESLFVYVVHLILLYGSPVNPEVHGSALWRGAMNTPAALAMTAGFTAVLAAGSAGWRFLKDRHPALLRTVQVWLAVVLLSEFLTSPY